MSYNEDEIYKRQKIDENGKEMKIPTIGAGATARVEGD